MRISDWSSDVCSSDLDDERWISGEIIGCQNNADHIEFDLEIDGLKSLTVGVAFGGFFSDHFEANPRSLTNYLGNLLGCKVALLDTQDSSRFDDRIVGIVPGGQKAMQTGERSEEHRVGKESVSTCRSR